MVELYVYNAYMNKYSTDNYRGVNIKYSLITQAS